MPWKPDPIGLQGAPIGGLPCQHVPQIGTLEEQSLIRGYLAQHGVDPYRWEERFVAAGGKLPDPWLLLDRLSYGAWGLEPTHALGCADFLGPDERDLWDDAEEW